MDDFSAPAFSENFRQVLAELALPEVETLLEGFAEQQIDILKPPAAGIVMISGRDCFDVDFYLGEVLVTTAEVSVNGARGHATVMGDEPAKALLAAVVEAVLESRQFKSLSHILPVVEALQQKLAAKHRQEARLTAATKVNFRSMAREDAL